jgi:dTMP kinase
VRERGRFITLEGGEGTGKSTQARRLADWLRAQGTSVVLTREPGGSPLAEKLRQVLLQGSVAAFGPDAEATFFGVARADHMKQTIRPALERGEWVVCDRFLDSTWAYQGSAGASRELLAKIDRVAVGDDRPDLTVVMDLPPQLGLFRLFDRGAGLDRFEADDIALHEARRRAFLDIAARDPARCVLVNADASVDEVEARIRAAVEARFGPIGGVR